MPPLHQYAGAVPDQAKMRDIAIAQNPRSKKSFVNRVSTISSLPNQMFRLRQSMDISCSVVSELVTVAFYPIDG